MTNQEVRWVQRFNNYKKAFLKFEKAILKITEEYTIRADGTIHDDEFLDDIIKEGLIQRFEYTHELAWNVLKDFFEHAGNPNIFGSKDATREAFEAGLILNGEVWMDMIKSRNKTSHAYNEATADEIFLKIMNQYYKEFFSFKEKMDGLQVK